MSVEAMARVLEQCPLRGTDKLILLGVANHDGDGGAWPSVATLARYASVDPRNARRAIARLVELGWLEVDQQAGGTARTADHQRPNLYRILWPTEDAPPGASAPPSPDTPGRQRPPSPGRHRPPPPGASAPRTIPEPPREPSPSGGQPADAAGHLPGIVDSQAGDEPVDPMALPWRLVREAYDARTRKPIESRKATARTVLRLLEAGWSEPQLADALRASPAWTPTSLQVELTRRGRQPAGRVPTTDDRRSGESRVVNMRQEMARRGR